MCQTLTTLRYRGGWRSTCGAITSRKVVVSAMFYKFTNVRGHYLASSTFIQKLPELFPCCLSQDVKVDSPIRQVRSHFSPQLNKIR